MLLISFHPLPLMLFNTKLNYISMPSYKSHSLFAIIFSLALFNPILIALSLIGANMLDFDHDVKTENILKMIIIGLLIAFALYFLKLNYLLGILIIVLALIFYLSEHRSYTHSILGILVLSLLISSIYISSFLILLIFKIPLFVAILLSTIFLAAIFLNKRLVMPFVLLFLISIFLFYFYNLPLTAIALKFSLNDNLLYLFIFISFLMGMLSHIALDSFTPQGVPIFKPFSNKNYRKSFGFIVFILWIIISIIFLRFCIFT